jgi:rubrerythrin
MKKSNIFQKKHELWLSLLFGAFSVEDDKMFDILYDFAMIEFRHLSWLGGSLVDEGEEFDYEKDSIDYIANDTHDLFKKLKENITQIQEVYPSKTDTMYARFLSDEEFFIQKIDFLLKSTKIEHISAYDKNRTLKGYELNKEQTDALTLFLFEESYKEYELILVYLYANFYTDSKLLSGIFNDLIYESQFHLKSFARMMRDMGILAVPRTLMEQIYKFDDLEKFLVDGIKEEEMAKEECLKLAEAVNNEDLGNFFRFINFQENYHIELMEKALKHIRGKDFE